MSWNSETHQFDPPPTLNEIWAETDPIKQGYQLADFVAYKARQKNLPLSETEQAHEDAYGVYGLIMGDGWNGLFDCYTQEAWSRVFVVLGFLGYSTLENALRKAIYLRNPRPIPAEDWDDPTVAQVASAEPTPEENEQFFNLESIAEPELLRLHHDLPTFAQANRDDFVDFHR